MYHHSLRYGVAFCCIGLLGAGCALPSPRQLSVSEVSSTTTATSTTPIHMDTPESVEIDMQTIDQTKELSAGHSCHTRIEYPVVQASSGMTADRAAQMNQYIRASLGETATSTLEQVVAANQQECIQQQQELQTSFPDEGAPSGLNLYEYQTETQITRNEAGVLSLLFTHYSYTGGAHPNSVLSSIVFDLATGAPLQLTDLVRPEVLSSWIQREEQALLASQYGEWLYDDAEARAIAAGSLQGEAASSTAAYSSREQWYLQDKNLLRYYQPYEIAAYAAGAPIVELPFASWQDLAVPGIDRWFR